MGEMVVTEMIGVVGMMVVMLVMEMMGVVRCW